MTAAVIGLIFMALGGLGIIYWKSDFLVVIKGFIPLSVFIGGVVALIAGLASFRSTVPDDEKQD